MKINYDKIKLEADRMGISVHLLIKKKYHYRKTKDDESGCHCCEYLNYVCYFNDRKLKIQCSFIGESKHDRHADINIEYTCDAFKND
jgi:hypothetical protein